MGRPARRVKSAVASPRTGSPVGGGFLAFTAATFVSFGLAVIDGRSDAFLRATNAVGRLGVVVATVYALAALMAGWRLLRTRNLSAGFIAAAYLGGAAWCWALFAQPATPPRFLTTAVNALAAAVALTLLIQGLRRAFWLEVFSGLGLVALALGTTLVSSDPASWAGSLPLVLLAGCGGLSCLYGGLVDIEVAERRTLVELLDSRQRVEAEMRRTEEILHDLRSGLLAIEAAIGSFDGDLATPLRFEAARLRRLTLRGERVASGFDLAEKVRNLVSTRQAGGTTVDLSGPNSAWVWGEESEVLTIIENLLSNAERHGARSPIKVDIAPSNDLIKLSVTNGGPGIGDARHLFERGVSTHPEGQGLGLSRAKALAQQNSAQLAFESSDDGLTTFTLELRSEPPVPA